MGELLRRPQGIDFYFDRVGGDHLEAALAARRRWRRVALCGAISHYGRAPSGPANLFQATANDLTLRGFRGWSHQNRLGEMQRAVASWLAVGRLRYRETIVDGLERAPEALVRTLAGDMIGRRSCGSRDGGGRAGERQLRLGRGGGWVGAPVRGAQRQRDVVSDRAVDVWCRIRCATSTAAVRSQVR